MIACPFQPIIIIITLAHIHQWNKPKDFWAAWMPLQQMAGSRKTAQKAFLHAVVLLVEDNLKVFVHLRTYSDVLEDGPVIDNVASSVKY